MNRNTLGLIVVGSGILFVVGQEFLLSPVTLASKADFRFAEMTQPMLAKPKWMPPVAARNLSDCHRTTLGSAGTNYCFFSTASLFSSVAIAASSLSNAA
jgi:hypothetical protein